jgi:hypothetical protein
MQPLKFDREATVEEIAGIGRHAGFDAVLDDKEDDAIQVICRRADGTEIPLANPARAFYFGDRILYTEEVPPLRPRREAADAQHRDLSAE